MKLSFVIPAYNEEAYIGECLASILREIEGTSYDVEVIVVNNASADRTGEVAASFPGVRVVHEPKKGLVQARHSGFLASSGDLIANVDADTLLPPGWIDKVFHHFSRDEKIVALSGPYIYHDLSKFTNVLVHVYYFLGYVGHRSRRMFSGKGGTMLQGGNFVLRRSALEAVGGFDLDFDFYGEDTAIARRIATQGDILFTFRFPMYTSGRRLAEEGVIAMAFRYGINHIWTIVFRKPFTRKYSDIRLKKDMTNL
jgi:glycosyltransferase involved in cell wall biosynthesis